MVDSNASILKQWLNRRRNEGADQEDSTQYVKQMEDAGISGNKTVHKQVLHSKFRVKKYSSVDEIRGKFVTVIDEASEEVILYEHLNILASEKLLRQPRDRGSGGGNVCGFGTGHRISFKKFNSRHRTRYPKYGCKLIREGCDPKHRGYRGARLRLRLLQRKQIL